MQLDVFNNEERVLLNSICKNEDLAGLAKNDVLQSLAFSRQIANEDDSMVISLVDGLAEKITSLTEEEWDDVKMHVPFAVALVAEDEVSEVPANED